MRRAPLLIGLMFTVALCVFGAVVYGVVTYEPREPLHFTGDNPVSGDSR